MIFPILELETTRNQQIEKMWEEMWEFVKEAEKGNTPEAIGECLDVIQAAFGFIEQAYGMNFMEAFVDQHYEKLRSRGWKLRGELVMEIKKLD